MIIILKFSGPAVMSLLLIAAYIHLPLAWRVDASRMETHIQFSCTATVYRALVISITFTEIALGVYGAGARDCSRHHTAHAAILTRRAGANVVCQTGKFAN